MARLAAVIAGVGLLLLALQGQLAAGSQQPEIDLAREFGAQIIDKPAPDFTVTRRDGSTARLSDFRGRVVFVNFWATWCPPCRKEMPDLEEMTRALDHMGVEVLAVSSDESWQEIDAFFKGHDTPLTVVLDTEKAISKAWGTEKLPETYVVDATGRMRLRFINIQPWTDPRIADYLAWLAAN